MYLLQVIRLKLLLAIHDSNIFSSITFVNIFEIDLELAQTPRWTTTGPGPRWVA